MTQQNPCDEQEDLILVGRLGRPFSLNGWLWLDDFGDVLDHLREGLVCILRKGGVTHQTEILSFCVAPARTRLLLAGISDRSLADSWVNADLFLHRSDFSLLSPGEYYWIDLIGLTVFSGAGLCLGIVHRLLRHAAHDLLEIQRPSGSFFLVPAIDPFIRHVDLSLRTVIIDWAGDDTEA